MCRGSCFFGYTAENSHHLTARIILKIRCFNRRKYQQENGADVKYLPRNHQKTNFCVWKKACQRATQATPLRTAPGFCDFYTWRKHQTDLQGAESTRRIETRRNGKGGKILRLYNNLITKQYFDALLLQEDVYSFSSPYCFDKLCSSPFCVPGK